MELEFIETPTFTRLIQAVLSDAEYRELQNQLLVDPAKGDVIRGGGGIRKLRFAAKGKGKSGGIRVIYYWVMADAQVYLLLAYPKSKKDTLTEKETALLREWVKGL